MGKVLANITLINQISEDDIRTLRIEDAIVDSGATLLSLSRDVIKELGLKKFKTVKVNAATPRIELWIYEPVRLEIMGREGFFEVMELKHPKIKALVGQIPLERLDFLIKPSVNRLIPDPDHDNQLVLDQSLTDDIIDLFIGEEGVEKFVAAPEPRSQRAVGSYPSPRPSRKA